jgi:hypothetical protein
MSKNSLREDLVKMVTKAAKGGSVRLLLGAAAVGVLAVPAIAQAAGTVVPTVKSVVVPKAFYAYNLVQARVVVATPRLANTKTSKVVITLLKGATPVGRVGEKRIPASKPFRSRLVKVDISVPTNVARGAYRLRICIAKSCKFADVSLVGLPRGYEGTFSLVASTASGAIRTEVNGTMRFESTQPGSQSYALVSGSATWKHTRTNVGSCSGSASGTVTFPSAPALTVNALQVIDGRASQLKDSSGNNVQVDPQRPYFYYVDVQTNTSLGNVTLDCGDSGTTTSSIGGARFLQAGTVPPWDPTAGLEQAVRKMSTSEEILGTRTATSPSGSEDWSWALESFD